MNDPARPINPVEIYLTREQIFRLAGLANDMLVGAQIGSDCADTTRCYVVMVSVDHPHDSKHYEISTDGTIEDVT